MVSGGKKLEIKDTIQVLGMIAEEVCFFWLNQ